MASYEATVRWHRGADETYTDNRYNQTAPTIRNLPTRARARE